MPTLQESGNRQLLMFNGYRVWPIYAQNVNVGYAVFKIVSQGVLKIGQRQQTQDAAWQVCQADYEQFLLEQKGKLN